MPYGYLGQNTPNQTVSNSGVFSISDVASLEKQGKFGGSLELIEEQNLTNVTQVDFTSIKENKYDVHFMNLDITVTSAGTVNDAVRLYESGVIESGSVYQYAYQYGSVGGTFGESKSTSATKMWLTTAGTGNHTMTIYAYFYNLGNSSKYSFSTFQYMVRQGSDAQTYMAFGGGVLPQTSTVDGIRYVTDITNGINGFAKLYGVKQL
jgi:hypothetical protein